MEDNQIKKPYISLQIAKLGSLYVMTEMMAAGMYADMAGMAMNMF